jgi:hypothetical protein
LAACAGCSGHSIALNANVTHGVYMSERFMHGFQFAHITPANDFVLVTVTVQPCLDPKEQYPGYKYAQEQGELKPLGDGYFVITDKGERIVLNITDDRLVMHDDEGDATLKHIKDAEFTTRATAYRRATIDHPDAICTT